MTGYRDVMKAASGFLFDVDGDGRCWVVLDGDAEAVAASPVGEIPPVGSRVYCASTYDRVLLLGFDGASTKIEQPRLPMMSRDTDSALTLDSQGLWKVHDSQALGTFMPTSGGVFTGQVQGVDAVAPDGLATLRQVRSAAGFGGSVVVTPDPAGFCYVDIGAGLLTAPPATVLVSLGSEAAFADQHPYVTDGTHWPAPTATRFYVGGLKPATAVRLDVWIVPDQAALYGSMYSPPASGTGTGSTVSTAPVPGPDVHLGAAGQSWAVYNKGTGARFWDQSKGYFGTYDASLGDHFSMVVWSAGELAALRAVPADKVTGMVLRVHVEHTFANSGGSVRVAVTNTAAPPATLAGPSALSWDVAIPFKSGTLDIPVPITFARLFAAGGNLTGFHLSATRGDAYGYGYTAIGNAEIFMHRNT